MEKYLDDRMYVSCLAKFTDVRLADRENKIIILHFKNIKGRAFYVAEGIVKNGEHILTLLDKLSDKEFVDFKSQSFDNTFAVLTFKNIAGYPPFKKTLFDTEEDALEHIRELIGCVPHVSLGGQPYKFDTDEDCIEYIQQYQLEEFFINDTKID